MTFMSPMMGWCMGTNISRASAIWGSVVTRFRSLMGEAGTPAARINSTHSSMVC